MPRLISHGTNTPFSQRRDHARAAAAQPRQHQVGSKASWDAISAEVLGQHDIMRQEVWLTQNWYAEGGHRFAGLLRYPWLMRSTRLFPSRTARRASPRHIAWWPARRAWNVVFLDYLQFTHAAGRLTGIISRTRFGPRQHYWDIGQCSHLFWYYDSRHEKEEDISTIAFGSATFPSSIISCRNGAAYFHF